MTTVIDLLRRGVAVQDVDGRAWRTPATAYPEASSGRASLASTRYGKDGLYHNYGVPFPGGGKPSHYRVRQGAMTVRLLKIDGEVWMVDDPPHHHGMLDHARHCSGRVVCAGLGLGLIVHALDALPQVERITVVEREPGVIALVGPLVPQGKLDIVHGTWEDYMASGAGRDADAVVYDLFVGDGPALLPAAIRCMIELHERFPRAKARRIHGFCSEALDRVARTAAAARVAASGLGDVGRLLQAVREAGGAP